MTLPVWAAEAAGEFWAAVGDPPPFPRDLRNAVGWGFPLSVIPLPGLRVLAACRWVAEQGHPVRTDEPDRPLRACLVAVAGHGFAFVDPADDPAERRFSVAHELGHFLLDYHRPRERTARALGPGILAVLDGRRPPTADERLHAVFRGLRVGPHLHLLRRDASGRPLTPDERDAEDRADRLAFELLAPADVVGVGSRKELTTRLIETFGLPPGPAAVYAEILAPAADPDPVVARLRAMFG